MEWITVVKNWPWEYIGPIIAALTGAVWAVYTFTHERKEDRKWKQVQFLLELNQRFFENSEIRECIRILDDTHRHSGLEKIFVTDRSSLTTSEVQLSEQFRTFFQFFDNLYRCYEMRALTLDQIDLFGWYIHRIDEILFLREYCKKNGFENVITLAKELEKHSYKVKRKT